MNKIFGSIAMLTLSVVLVSMMITAQAPKSDLPAPTPDCVVADDGDHLAQALQAVAEGDTTFPGIADIARVMGLAETRDDADNLTSVIRLFQASSYTQGFADGSRTPMRWIHTNSEDDVAGFVMTDTDTSPHGYAPPHPIAWVEWWAFLDQDLKNEYMAEYLAWKGAE